MKIGRINSSQDGIVYSVDGISPTLSAGHNNQPKILIDESNITTGQGLYANIKNRGGRSMTKKHSHDVIQINMSTESGGKQPYQQNGIYDTEGISPSLSVGNGCNSGMPKIVEKSNIRRLTEVECERLQTLPDNFTKFGNYDGKIRKISSTQRYKMCGNGVTADVVKIIGKKILKLNY